MSIPFVTLLAVAVTGEVLLSQAKAPLPPTIAEIVRDVREHESAERDIDLQLTRTYALAPGTAVHGTETRRSQKDVHWVSQETRFRLQSDSSSVDTTGKADRSGQVISFDGTNTRIANSGGETIEPGRHDEHVRLCPELLLYPLRNGATLGNWLEHGESYGTPSHDQNRHSIEFESFETIDGVPCVRVLSSSSSRNENQWFHQWRFWLASERGYSIARIESLRWINGKSVVSADGKVSKWMAMPDGTWIPEEGLMTKYEFSPDGVAKPRWTEHFVIRSASLRPKHADSFFSDITKAVRSIE